jgi:hypothetical protein
LAKNDPCVAGAVIHGPGQAWRNVPIISLTVFDMIIDVPSMHRGGKSGSLHLSRLDPFSCFKISISALKIELDSHDGMRSFNTSQSTIHETTHGGKKYNHQNPRKIKTTERESGSQRQTRETQEQDKGQTMTEIEWKPQMDDSNIAGQRI